MKKFTTGLLTVFAILISYHCQAQIIAEAEGSIVIPGYNEIRVPGEGGTTFDAVKDLGNNLRVALRLRGGYRWNNRNNLFVLLAPLKLKFNGSFNNAVNFYGRTFIPDRAAEVNYVFNSYRLTYRYDFITFDKLRIGAGLTAKIRDAYIEVSQDGNNARKKNLGIVPLINFMAHYQINETFGVILEGDGLATGKGRAFDIQLSMPIMLDEFLGAKIGYRVLEGGANNKEVYNFSWTNYIQASIFYNMY